MTAGLLLTYLCYALISVSDSAVKALGHTPMSSFEIAFFTALFAGLAAVPLKPRGERWRDLFRMRHPLLLIVRSFSGLAAGVLGVVSLITIPFAETYALIFMSPFLVTLMSVLFAVLAAVPL